MRSRREKDVARGELIGLDVVVASAHAEWDGLSGRIVDETRNTLLVETPKGEKRIPKPGQRFELLVEGDRVTVSGDEIMFQPEERTKKIRG